MPFFNSMFPDPNRNTGIIPFPNQDPEQSGGGVTQVQGSGGFSGSPSGLPGGPLGGSLGGQIPQNIPLPPIGSGSAGMGKLPQLGSQVPQKPISKPMGNEGDFGQANRMPGPLNGGINPGGGNRGGNSGGINPRGGMARGMPQRRPVMRQSLGGIRPMNRFGVGR